MITYPTSWIAIGVSVFSLGLSALSLSRSGTHEVQVGREAPVAWAVSSGPRATELPGSAPVPSATDSTRPTPESAPATSSRGGERRPDGRTEARSDAKPGGPDSGREKPSSLVLKRMIVTTRMKLSKREPEGTREIKVGKAPVFAFLELGNPGDKETVVVSFEHADGTVVGNIRLDVPAHRRRWRTWAKSQNIKKAGSWSAIARTGGGLEIGRREFVVKAP